MIQGPPFYDPDELDFCSPAPWEEAWALYTVMEGWTVDEWRASVGTPAFYNFDEWDPDGPTIKEMLGFHAIHSFMGGILLSPWQLQLLQKLMQEEHGRHWKAPFQAFVDELTPVVDQFNKTVKAMEPVVKAMRKPVPRHGPQWNPHARNGKGARR